MELHNALRHIIKTDGERIICELRVVNILSDLNAYGDIQGAKYIMRALVDEGVTKKLLQIGALNKQACEAVTRFIFNTGFNSESVQFLVNSIGYAMGWTSTLPSLTMANQQGNVQVQPTKKNDIPDYNDLLLTSSQIVKQNQAFRVDYCDRAVKYLDSIVKYGPNIKNNSNLEIRVFSKYVVYDNPTSALSWTVEINGNIPVRKGDFIRQCFNIVLYDHSGRILDSKGVFTYSTIRSFAVIETEKLHEDTFKSVGNIAKILVYEVND